MNILSRTQLSIFNTPFGRRDFRFKLFNRAYPILRRLAWLYRRLLLRRMRLITVVGSLGKTTTCRTIAAVVGDKNPAGFGNHKNSIIRNLFRHTPFSDFAVIETAIGEPGLMAGYAGMLNPDIVVVTSIASEHILSFGSLENTRLEKSKMLSSLSPDKIAILNADDPNVVWMSGRTQARIITFGIENQAEVMAEQISISPPDGMTFLVNVMQTRLSLRISLLGRHMIYPFLAALAVADSCGINLEDAAKALERVSPAEARMQAIELPSGVVLIRDEYKATKETVWKALETLEEYPAKRKFLVLGGVSEITNQERYNFFRSLGGRIGDICDAAFLFLPRKTFQRCRSGATGGNMKMDRMKRISSDPLSILSMLPKDLGKGDVLLIKGKNEYKAARLSLALTGRQVGCRLLCCSKTTSFCDSCEMLERGWGERTQV